MQIALKRPLSDDFRMQEAYKILRTNILFCGKNLKTILLTSCVPNEGKTTVTINLAISMADLGKKVLLIDCDLRRPSLIKAVVDRVNIKGLSHYFSGQKEAYEIIYNTEYKNLDVVFSGTVPPNPSELLATEDFKQFISNARNKYDYIIIDTPPLGSVIDSAIIAENCDGAILVVESEKNSYKYVNTIKSQLSRSGCSILGVVLNKCSPKKDSYYYYNKKDYYYGS